MERGAPVGRRVRKARATRQRIVDAALPLFMKDGFDGTTLDAIAEAADISRRSFFNYFASKEAIVEALDDSLNELFRDALREVTGQPSPLKAVQAALGTVVASYTSVEAAALHDLMYSTEGLRARKQASYVRQERALYEALQELWPDPSHTRGLQMVAIIGIGVLRVVVDRWRDNPELGSLTECLDDAFAQVRSAVHSG